VIEQIKQLRQPAARSAARAYLEVGDRRIELSFLSSIGPDELLFRLAEVTAGGDEQFLQKTLQLTGREAEVLLWISRGKSNREIGEILHISPRTVNKHLEQVFVKLGVENRASAAARAVRALAR
jgi:DNA-binding CsgD family transcriptional regulator